MIKNKRIRNLKSHLSHIETGTQITIGIHNIGRFPARLEQIGFSHGLPEGETVLPAIVGPVTRFNAEGGYDVHRDQPMETAYRTIEWSWTEWHGPYDVHKTDFRDCPYERYPRTFIEPPSIEMTIAAKATGEKVIIAPALAYEAANEKLLLHTINLFLEIFGECELFTPDLEDILFPDIKRLNWTVLPAGKHPWAQLRKHIDRVIAQAPGGNQPVIAHRLKTINSYGPDFAAVGHAGFNGYVILGFREENVFICESIHPDNATYVFGEDWETLSQRSKAEILSDNLHLARLIHRQGWEDRLAAFFAN